MTVMTMVERSARALCTQQGVDPDSNWVSRIAEVEAVLIATMLPPIPPLAREGDAAEYAVGRDWSAYRKFYGKAGARAREPKLLKLTGWHVQAAWKTWNGMVAAALYDQAPDELREPERAPDHGA